MGGSNVSCQLTPSRLSNKISKFADTVFGDKGVKKSAQSLSLPLDHFRLHTNGILQAMYFCKTIAIFLTHLSFFV